MFEDNFFEKKIHSPIRFLSIMVLSLIILFGFVGFIEYDNGITGYAVNEDNLTKVDKVVGDGDVGEVYTTKAWGIFYIFIISLVTLVAFVSVILKKTIWQNIAEETKSGGFVD